MSLSLQPQELRYVKIPVSRTNSDGMSRARCSMDPGNYFGVRPRACATRA